MTSTHAGLAIDGSGNLYGVNWQAVFKLSPKGSGAWKPTVILGRHPLVGGVATFQASALPVGKTKVRAIFFGDLNFLPSKSGWITQVVEK